MLRVKMGTESSPLFGWCIPFWMVHSILDGTFHVKETHIGGKELGAKQCSEGVDYSPSMASYNVTYVLNMLVPSVSELLPFFIDTYIWKYIGMSEYIFLMDT